MVAHCVANFIHFVIMNNDMQHGICESGVCFKETWTLLVNQLPTITHVTSLAACQRVLAAASTGMDRHRFSDDQSILHQFSDLLACSINTMQ